MLRYFLSQCICLLLAVCLTACSSFTHARYLNIHIQAARYLNPDSKGKAAPVKLTFYELKSNRLFDKVNFFKLQDNSVEVLQNTLIDQRSFMISPEEKLNFRYQFSSKARYLGVVVGYRHLSFSEWKKIISLNEKHTSHMNVVLGASSFLIDKR